MSRFLIQKIQFIILIILFQVIAFSIPLIRYASGELIIQTEDQIEKAAGIINACLNREAKNILVDIVRGDLPDKNKAFFLLGRLYREEGDLEKAEDYLIKAADAFPLLRDYTLKLLTDVYIADEKFEKAIGTSQQIKNKLLLQLARQSEINALFALKKEEKAKEAFFQYITRYREDWEYKLTIAMLLKDNGEIEQAIRLFRDVYINAIPLSEDAIKELKSLNADSFTKEELLKRADNLFENNDFQQAEFTYKKVINLIGESEKDRVRFQIGMCQFRQKKYNESANSFGFLNTPKSLYWQARSFYRGDDINSFNRIKNEFEESYPNDKLLALLFLMEADELRRKGELSKAEKSYKKVSANFPENVEDAIWGLGWMNYMSGDYKAALNYFSKLSSYDKSRDYYKYLYWKARTEEKLFKNCVKNEASQESNINKEICNKENEDFFNGLPADESYYGYLIKLRSPLYKIPDKIEVSKPAKPEGEVYERIEALALLGMRDEAVNEIIYSLKRSRKPEEFIFLGYMAIGLDEYKNVIAFAEKREERVFLYYSYPPGYWDILKQASDLENLDIHLIAALIREESRFDPLAISWAGAIGLMQLMPSTAYRLKKDIHVYIENNSELQDVRKNILLGTHYLSKLIDEFKEVPLAIAAYNAGENTLKDFMSRFNNIDIIEFIENIPYKETRRYVKKVLKSYWQYRSVNGLPVSGISGQLSGTSRQALDP